MNYFQHSGFPWSVENQGKTKIFQGQEKVRDFFEKLKEIENEDRDIDGVQQKQANVRLHNRHYFFTFSAEQSQSGNRVRSTRHT